MARKLNEQATCRGMAIPQSAKFQSSILSTVSSLVWFVHTLSLFPYVNILETQRHRNLGESRAGVNFPIQADEIS